MQRRSAVGPSRLRSRARRSTLASFVGLCAATTARPIVAQPADAPADAPAVPVEEILRFAAQQYPVLLGGLPDATRLPRTVARGEPVRVPREDWTSGFFPGVLWLLHEATGLDRWRDEARRFTRTLEPLQSWRGDHDVGFMLGCSVGNGLRLTGDRAYRDVLVNGARSLATRFDPRVGMIRSWDHGQWAYPVIVDTMMNLELLALGAQLSADAGLLEIAIRHADATLAHHCRPDGGTVHLVDLDPVIGAVRQKRTVQGAADGSTWARGQAWGVYGFTMMYRETGLSRYLAQAERMARFVLEHPRLPADGIPYWDYDAPGIPGALRDASAAAITASALIELAPMLSDGALSGRLLRLARTQLRTLASPPYRSAPGGNGGFLLGHSVGALPLGSEIDVPLIYADYYFLEGVLRLRRGPNG
ncbi:MAG: hypothetical protein RJA99_1218 [Pseudomonadota bacterium]|jgi:hypothetical protein